MCPQIFVAGKRSVYFNSLLSCRSVVDSNFLFSFYGVETIKNVPILGKSLV